MPIQYRTITEEAGVVDVSARGRVRIDGPDAASFLHALVTNDVEHVPSGRGVYAAWLTPQGRMIADLRVFRDDMGLFVGVPEGLGARVQQQLDLMIFAEQVTVADVTESTEEYVVFGRRAAEHLAPAIGLEPGTLADLPMFGHMAAGDWTVARVDDTALPTFALWRPKTTSGNVFGVSERPFLEIQAEKREGGSSATPKTLPDVVFEGLGIEAGRPKFGVDMTTDTIPLEAGLLDRAISQTKGCYVGQEVIVRILHRGGGRVAKRLVQLRWPEGDGPLPVAGASVGREGHAVGAVTRAAMGPTLGARVALAYVAREAAVEGSVVEVGGAGAARLETVIG